VRPPGRSSSMTEGVRGSALDLALLGTMPLEPGSPAHGADPMLPAARLASRLGVSRNTVFSHLARWRVRGFLVRFLVFPNPLLFGARMTGVVVRCTSPAGRRRLQRAMEFSDEVFSSVDLEDQCWVVFLERGRSDLARWRRLFAGLDACEIESEFVPIRLPAPTRLLQRFDRRLLDALRSAPFPQTPSLARSLGVSSRTITRHYRRLLDSRACLAWALHDYGKFPGAVAFVTVTFASSLAPEEIRAVVDSSHCQRLPAAPLLPQLSGEATSGRGSTRQLGLLFHAGSPMQAVEVARRLRDLNGVRDFRLAFPGRPVAYLRCFDRWAAEPTSSGWSAREKDRVDRPARTGPRVGGARGRYPE
jgi:hypothetical protein